MLRVDEHNRPGVLLETADPNCVWHFKGPPGSQTVVHRDQGTGVSYSMNCFLVLSGRLFAEHFLAGDILRALA